MSFTFLIPMAIFLIAAYIFKNSTDEISYLAALISLISLFFSLAFSTLAAPVVASSAYPV
jgi:hypothetical protein